MNARRTATKLLIHGGYAESAQYVGTNKFGDVFQLFHDYGDFKATMEYDLDTIEGRRQLDVIVDELKKYYLKEYNGANHQAACVEGVTGCYRLRVRTVEIALDRVLLNPD